MSNVNYDINKINVRYDEIILGRSFVLPTKVMSCSDIRDYMRPYLDKLSLYPAAIIGMVADYAYSLKRGYSGRVIRLRNALKAFTAMHVDGEFVYYGLVIQMQDEVLSVMLDDHVLVLPETNEHNRVLDLSAFQEHYSAMMKKEYEELAIRLRFIEAHKLSKIDVSILEHHNFNRLLTIFASHVYSVHLSIDHNDQKITNEDTFHVVYEYGLLRFSVKNDKAYILPILVHDDYPAYPEHYACYDLSDINLNKLRMALNYGESVMCDKIELRFNTVDDSGNEYSTVVRKNVESYPFWIKNQIVEEHMAKHISK